MKLLDDEFRLVPKDYLVNLEHDCALGFDVFSFQVDETGHVVNHTQIADAKTECVNLASQLREHGGADVLIKNHCYKQLQKLLEKSVGNIIRCDKTPLERKSEVIYECASNIMEDVFNDPRSGENINRTRKISSHIIDFALQSDASIPSLLALGSHDYYTFTHCINVTVFGIGLWHSIVNGPIDELMDFTLGCMFHDIGKTKVSEQILNKPGKLDEDEFSEIKKHPRHGYHIMKEFLPRASLDVILHHHERIDGSGYPDGLTENMISDNAKIASIADVYDALTTNRPYSDARKPFNAVLLMKEQMVGFFAQQKLFEFIKMLGKH